MRSPVRNAAPQRGVTLVELIVAVVIISVALAGVLAAFNASVRGSADPMVSKQMTSIAEALMEEVQQAAFTFCDPNDAAAETASSVADCTTPEVMGAEAGDTRPFDNVSDYHGLSLATITDEAGVAVPSLAGYSATISVAPVSLFWVAAASGDLLQVTVRVTAPNGQTFTLDGYRARYAPNALP
jgi:MSHA pilin protein MshD